jgi:molecular chaperone DnaK (HSP70)
MFIGIDLGTTNSAVAFIDPREAEGADFPPIRLLDIPQHIDEQRMEARRLLPSFLYLGDQRYIGAYAREQAALTPTRVVSSAKSWLSNSEVDREAKILPWDARDTERSVSPVEASTAYIAHMRSAWDQSRRPPMQGQRVVLTVPASFDEEARELTVAAAQQAGLNDFSLLEEPSAAFYAWVALHPTESRKLLFDGQHVLVCDVGGGTTDFTLIRVGRDGDKLEFTRTAVGKHLLLGGDNLDLTLAWLVETKAGKALSLRQRSALRRQCAAAKERLLAEDGPSAIDITVLGGGSALVGGAIKTDITREEAIELAFDGFLPECSLADRPAVEKRSVFRELGLPYVSDPAITRHLAEFLAGAGAEAARGPDAILFNGGFFNPSILRDRLTAVMRGWYGREPTVLENRDLDLAVAVGAAYHCYVRATGAGLMVRGGLPRTYYIGIAGADGGPQQGVCLVPRGAEAGALLELDRDGLQLLANRPVSFRLYSSLTRVSDHIGDVIEFPDEQLGGDIHLHAPLQAVIRFGKRTGERHVPVKLRARLTEIGTLEIWAVSNVSEHEWKLQFELRKPVVIEQQQIRSGPSTVIAETAAAQAIQLLRDAFSDRESPVPQEELPARLEQILGLGRNSWPLETLRQLGDALLESAEGRRKGAAWEVRWLNLCGFCLRPGFGFPGDDFRLEQTRRVYASGLAFPNRDQNQVDWWIFWGRLAGGLKKNQQTDLYQRLSGTLFPGKGKRPRVNASLLREMWRTASSLELLPSNTRTQLGESLIARVRANDYGDNELWCLSRIGARQLFYGPANQVLAPSTVSPWVQALLRAPKAGDALAAIARRTGDPTRDLPEAVIESVRQRLEGESNAERLIAILEGDEPADAQSLSRIFGEQLPSGLVLGQTAPVGG